MSNAHADERRPALACDLRLSSGMEITELRARIRKMRETGDIPCDPPKKIWAGHGRDHRCAACGEVIAPTEVEFEVDLQSSVTIRLHRRCHAIWWEECGH
jgi:hypothetical protein